MKMMIGFKNNSILYEQEKNKYLRRNVIMLTEEFKKRYERIASEDGNFGPFDWEAIEKRMRQSETRDEDYEKKSDEVSKSAHPKKIINYKKKNYGNEQN